MLKRIVDFEVAPPKPRDARPLAALVTSAILHALIILVLLFGIPTTNDSANVADKGAVTAQPLAVAAPTAKPLPKLAQQQQQQQTPPQPPPPPPPPLKEQELGPDSKKPDAPAKEAAAKKATADPADAVNAKQPDQTPTPPATEQPKPPEAQPPAPQKIQIPRPGDYTGSGRIPTPTTSPWGPPKIDSASGAPPTNRAITPTAGAMGRAGLANRDPQKWENSFDDETSGKCAEIPDLGKNPDGSPVLGSVLGRVLDTDGKSPLAGAHLQIMGTTFGTFSDMNGEYRLQFDPRMLAKCRVQYVQVVAAGHVPELLKLWIGPKVRSDDVVLRRGGR